MDKYKAYASQLTGIAGALGKFVEDNIIDKKQREENLRKLTFSLEKLVTDRMNKQREELVPLKVKKLANFKGELPKYESRMASGLDVRAQIDEDIVLQPGERKLIPTGLSFAIPQGYEIQARPRSGLAIKSGISLVNTPGTIDADYRGEVKIILINHSQETFTVKDQERVAQLVLCPVVQANLMLVDDLDETERGSGGFGSTGAQ